MLIDAILDRKDGAGYNPKEFYNYLNGWARGIYDDVCRVLDEGSNEDIQRALCEYIVKNDYNPAICEYINSVDWLVTEGVIMVTCQDSEGNGVLIKSEKIALNTDDTKADEFLMNYARSIRPVNWVCDDFMQLVHYPNAEDKRVYFLCNFN